MCSLTLMLLCVLPITLLNGAAISDNDRTAFMGYIYEKPSIAFDLPQDWIKMKPVDVIDNAFEQATIASGIGQETLENLDTNKEVAIFPNKDSEVKIEDNIEPVVVESTTESADTDMLAIDLRGNFDEVEFQYPSPYFNATEVATNFEHQELASQHEVHRRGPVKRIKFKGALQNFNFTTYTASLKGCAQKTVKTEPAVNQVEWSPKSNQRPPNRRIAPYTEVSTDEAYFHQ